MKLNFSRQAVLFSSIFVLSIFFVTGLAGSTEPVPEYHAQSICQDMSSSVGAVNCFAPAHCCLSGKCQIDCSIQTVTPTSAPVNGCAAVGGGGIYGDECWTCHPQNKSLCSRGVWDCFNCQMIDVYALSPGRVPSNSYQLGEQNKKDSGDSVLANGGFSGTRMLRRSLEFMSEISPAASYRSLLSVAQSIHPPLRSPRDAIESGTASHKVCSSDPNE